MAATQTLQQGAEWASAPVQTSRGLFPVALRPRPPRQWGRHKRLATNRSTLGVHTLPASCETGRMRVAFLNHPHSEAGWNISDCVLAAARLVDETIEVV